ncbi:related to COQ2-para-hydroxybenzoate--polyprenyltransferase [Lecanosticta acicola]|uniref:Calcium uniporter protein n=1 Tax=Lecanosticta acicola TaxID=111012 RepID=A0AAI8YUB7_9PEZI|nr:related to COQ2-para-hydroxybenzoate--polyprenyltransferase [Lecanosticta acicola]
MEPLLSRLIVQAAPISKASRSCRSSTPISTIPTKHAFFSTTPRTRQPRERQRYDTASAPDSSYSKPAADVSQHVTREEKDHFARVEEQSKHLQTRSPWMHDGSDVPPVQRNRSAGAMTKGKLLTTPSRMLKLVLPMTTRDANQDRKDVEPLALLVHPQQPLSYLERLIQSELPFMWDEKKGRERAPEVSFRAQDSMEESVGGAQAMEDENLEKADEMYVDGKKEKTGKISSGKEDSESDREKGLTADTEKEERFGTAEPEDRDFVRWSPSTEIGDFIRDAARGKEFAVDIEGAPESIYVGVPSFQDRTYYLRMRLRKVSKRISNMADVKRECDELAHRGAKMVARMGFAGLLSWWGVVYYLTFRTDLGWDVMEPVTYLVGLSGLIGGYMWFLYHNREVSYRSAMHYTVSRRQDALYKAKGFNLPQWEMLIEEGNRLRREIKLVAEEYDVDWDETKDEGDEKVREALRKERKKAEKKKEDKEGKEEDKDGD